MKSTFCLALVASVLASVAVGSAHAVVLPTTQLTPVIKYKGPTPACTLIKTSAGWYNPCTKVTIPFFG